MSSSRKTQRVLRVKGRRPVPRPRIRRRDSRRSGQLLPQQQQQQHTEKDGQRPDQNRRRVTFSKPPNHLDLGQTRDIAAINKLNPARMIHDTDAYRHSASSSQATQARKRMHKRIYSSTLGDILAPHSENGDGGHISTTAMNAWSAPQRKKKKKKKKNYKYKWVADDSDIPDPGVVDQPNTFREHHWTGQKGRSQVHASQFRLVRPQRIRDFNSGRDPIIDGEPPVQNHRSPARKDPMVPDRDPILQGHESMQVPTLPIKKQKQRRKLSRPKQDGSTRNPILMDSDPNVRLKRRLVPEYFEHLAPQRLRRGRKPKGTALSEERSTSRASSDGASLKSDSMRRLGMTSQAINSREIERYGLRVAHITNGNVPRLSSSAGDASRVHGNDDAIAAVEADEFGGGGDVTEEFMEHSKANEEEEMGMTLQPTSAARAWRHTRSNWTETLDEDDLSAKWKSSLRMTPTSIRRKYAGRDVVSRMHQIEDGPSPQSVQTTGRITEESTNDDSLKPHRGSRRIVPDHSHAIHDIMPASNALAGYRKAIPSRIMCGNSTTSSKPVRRWSPYRPHDNSDVISNKFAGGSRRMESRDNRAYESELQTIHHQLRTERAEAFKSWMESQSEH